MIFKEIIHNYKQADHEEVPQEELWEDGELMRHDVISKIVYRVLDKGDWMLVRKTVRHKDVSNC